MAVFWPRRGGVKSGTVIPQKYHVSDNGNIMRVLVVWKAVATEWDSRQTIPLCSQGRAYGSGAKGGVTPTENLEGWSQRYWANVYPKKKSRNLLINQTISKTQAISWQCSLNKWKVNIYIVALWGNIKLNKFILLIEFFAQCLKFAFGYIFSVWQKWNNLRQLISSSLSKQSLWPSHTFDLFIHTPFEHWNCPCGQRGYDVGNAVPAAVKQLCN